MHLATALQFLWYADTGATLVLLARLVSSRLVRTYRYFWWYLLISFSESAVRIPLQGHFKLQADVYMLARSIGVVISVFLVMELYWLALASHPAIARYGRRVVGYLLGSACLAAGAGLLIFPILGPGRSRVVYYFLAFERTADSTVLLFLLIASAFMIWFPVRISKNVAVFIGGFVAYFLTRWVGLLTIGIHRTSVDVLNVAMMALSLICVVGWIVFLRPEGERTVVVSGRHWNDSEMARLEGQLTAINTKLQEISR